MMSPCKQCLENNWKYEYIDKWIRATCQICGFEVEFEAKKREPKPEKPQKDVYFFNLYGEQWMHKDGQEYPIELKTTPKWIKIVRKNDRLF